MNVDDVRAFHARGDPAVGGDADGGRRLRARRRSSGSPPDAFGDWDGASDADVPPAARCRRPARLNVVPRPRAPQSELRIGHVAVGRDTPDYHALVAGEHGPRRAVRQPHQPESARGQGLHLRRPHRVRVPPAARAVRAAGQRADGGDRAARSSESIGEIAGIRGPRPVTRRRARARRRGADARLRAQLRDRRADRPRRHCSSRSTICRTTTSRSSCRAIERVTSDEVSRVMARAPRSRRA